MQSIYQSLFLLAVPILGLAVFSYTWLLEIASSFPSQWNLQSSIPPQVKLAQGLVVGTLLDHKFLTPIEGFMGLPYAEAPTGERRFSRAIPLPASNTTFEAMKYGPICPGKQLLSGKASENSEDCMTVNIFRQRPASKEVKVPVAVYIHGGAFNRGSSMMHNTASMVAWAEKPFIGVSFNYRIGALGFLPSKLTFDEGIVNLGLHDQVFLLQWVQDNIEEFGGDKNDVTIFGLSAGAHSIGHHIMNYQEGVVPLFHKAILESGASTSRAVHPYNAPVHEEQFALFVSEAGCSGIPAEDITSCLRSQDENIVTAASIIVFDKYNPSLRWAFQPVIDGNLIHQRPIDAWISGKWNRVPIMTGHTTNEGTYYVPSSLSTSEGFTDFWHTLLPHYSKEDLATINALYPDPSIDANSPYTESRDMEALGIGPQFKRVEASYAHHACLPVKGGANHADNMYYESFQDEVTSISDAQREVSGVYHAYVTSFITGGNPNSIRGRFGNRPEWEQYGRGQEGAMTFGKGNDERAGGSGRGVAAAMIGNKWIEEQCKFWKLKSADTEE